MEGERPTLIINLFTIKTMTKTQSNVSNFNKSKKKGTPYGNDTFPIREFSVTGMTHFDGECYPFNLHLKRIRFGLFVKPHVSNKKLNMTKSADN